MRFVDSHTHLYLRGAEDLELMATAGIRATAVCAFLPVKPSSADSLKDLFRWLVEAERERQARYGIRALPVLGIHPRCIPAAGLDAALSLVDEMLWRKSAVALGEVGLETGSAEEVKVLQAQLEIARHRGMPAIVHTPRGDKYRVIERLLGVLEESKIDPGKVVIDHLTADLVAPVRERGFLAGLTVQPGKIAPDEVLAIVKLLGSDGILVNSDSAHVDADPLAVPRVARCLEDGKVAPEDVAKVTGGNAAALFGLQGW